MTKKDYELIARVLRRRVSNAGPGLRSGLRALASEFADELAGTNPHFDRARFIAACLGEDSTDSAGRRVRYSA